MVMTVPRMGKTSRRCRSRENDEYYKISSKRRRLRYEDSYDCGYEVNRSNDSYSYDKHSERYVVNI